MSHVITVENARDDAIAARRRELLTVQEYADLMRMNVKYIYNRIREGRQPGLIDVGGTYRIDLTVLRQLPACCPNCGQRFSPPERDDATLELPF